MQILFGSIPSIVMMYITGVLEEMVKDLWLLRIFAGMRSGSPNL